MQKNAAFLLPFELANILHTFPTCAVESSTTFKVLTFEECLRAIRARVSTRVAKERQHARRPSTKDQGGRPEAFLLTKRDQRADTWIWSDCGGLYVLPAVSSCILRGKEERHLSCDGLCQL